VKQLFEQILAIARSALRYRRLALLVFILVTLLGATAVLLLPSEYQSRAQIFVDTRSILRPLLQGIAVSSETEDQTNAVRRALLARPSLVQVAEKTGMFSGNPSTAKREDTLKGFAEKISLTGDSSTGIYQISYSSHDPGQAQQVVSTLLDTFVRNSLNVSRSDTENAEQFFDDQVKDYEKQLSEKEQQLADFKKRNIGFMPDQRGDYFARLQAETASLEKIESELVVAEQQRNALRTKLSAGIAGGGAGAVDQAAMADALSPQNIQAATALDEQVRESRKQLNELLLRFTERHPDVIALKEKIQRLEGQRASQFASVRQTNGTVVPNSGGVVVDPVVQSLQISLNSADLQITSLRAQQAQAGARVAELRRMVNAGPEVEAELSTLNRDYGVIKERYEDLLRRRESARLSNSADRNESVRYRELEPPHKPVLPSGPNRPLFLFGVAIFALGCGAVAAVGMALIRPVFYTRSQVAARTGLPVLGVISAVRTGREMAMDRMQRVFLWGVLASVLVGLVFLGSLSTTISDMLRTALGMATT